MSFFNTPEMNIPGVLGTLYSYSIFLNAALSFILGFFVLVKGFRKRLNVYWFLLSMCVSFWAFFIFLWSRGTAYEEILLVNRIANYGAIFLAIMVVMFTEEYVRKKSRAVSLFNLLAGLLILTAGLVFYKEFIPSESPKVFFKLYPDTGIVFAVYFLYFACAWTYALMLMWNHYKRMEGIAKKQTGLILTGITMGILGGSTTFFACFNINIFPFGSSFSLIYVIFTTYAIIRYRAMEIDTVVHQTVIWLLSLAILILPIGVIFSFFKEELRAVPPVFILVLISFTLLLFLFYYNRLKPGIDHFFRRRKYDYQLVLSEMPSRIGSSLDLKLLSRNMAKEFRETLYVRNLLLLVKPLDKQSFNELDCVGYGTKGNKVLAKQDNVSLAVDHPIIRFFQKNIRVLEKDQIEIDPVYETIRTETLEFFRENSLEILVPFTIQGNLISILGLGKKENLTNYALKDIELLEYIGSQIGITIDNALHHSDILEKERIAEELRLGQQIQKSLLPHAPPQVPDLAIQGFMQPAREIGGDYYDFINLPGRLVVVIGDVSGKGVAAGLLMAMVKTAMHLFSRKDDSPKEVLKKLNLILNQQTGEDKFMTMMYLIWQADKKTFLYSSAAHENALIYRKARDQIETLRGGGALLGVMPDIDKFLYDEEIPMNPGDKILLFTDGVVSALNANKDRFGLTQLKSVFLKYAGEPAREIMYSVKNEIYSFMGSLPQQDDITLVVLERV
ncbi:MAG: SpoIIE family protein phosphatase [bacterium]|nr:SpoIIE family protein phosphatase [bacterium]